MRFWFKKKKSSFSFTGNQELRFNGLAKSMYYKSYSPCHALIFEFAQNTRNVSGINRKESFGRKSPTAPSIDQLLLFWINVVCEWFVELSLWLISSSRKYFTLQSSKHFLLLQFFSCSKAILSLPFLFYVLQSPDLSSFQVLAVTPQPVKLSSSHFTTKMDIILSNWLSIEISNMPCIAVQIPDPGLVTEMTSTYQTTLWAIQHRIPSAAIHTLFQRDIQLVTVGFSLEANISVPLTSKCSTK